MKPPSATLLPGTRDPQRRGPRPDGDDTAGPDARRRDAGDAGTLSRNGNAADGPAPPQPAGRSAACGIFQQPAGAGLATGRPRRRGLALALLALGAAAGACSHPSTQEVETEDRVPVVTRPATRGVIRPLVAATGTVRPAPGGELVVNAPQPARIAELPRAVGERVRRGELLVRFDIPSLAADAGDRGSAVAMAEARLTNAAAALQRVRGLFERGIAARKELRIRAASVVVPSIILALRICASVAVIDSPVKPLPRTG